MARNPKDVIVSNFYYHKIFRFMKFTGNFESFVDYFLSNKGNVNAITLSMTYLIYLLVFLYC